MPDSTVTATNRTRLDDRFAVDRDSQARMVTGITLADQTYWAHYGTAPLSFRVRRPAGVTQSNPAYTIVIADVSGAFRRSVYNESTLNLLDGYLSPTQTTPTVYRTTVLDIVNVEATEQDLTIKADITAVYKIKVPLGTFDASALGNLLNE